MCRFFIEGSIISTGVFSGWIMDRLGRLVEFPVNLVGVSSSGMGRLCPLVGVWVIPVGVFPSGVDRCVPWLDKMGRLCPLAGGFANSAGIPPGDGVLSSFLEDGSFRSIVTAVYQGAVSCNRTTLR